VRFLGSVGELFDSIISVLLVDDLDSPCSDVKLSPWELNVSSHDDQHVVGGLKQLFLLLSKVEFVR